MSRHRPSTRSWWRRVAVGLLAALAAALVAGAVVVNLEHIKLEPVLSGSMRPGIQPGDLAIVRPVPVSSLHKGEVIAYLPPNQTTPVMHRIVSIDSQGIVTKGDANPVADPWGRVKPSSSSVEHLVTVVPKIGFLIDIKRQLLAVAGGVLLLALALGLWSWGRPRKPFLAGRGESNKSSDEASSEETEFQLLTQPKEM